MARTMAAKFKAMEKVRLHLMVNIIRRARRSRWGSSWMSSLTRAMSAASTAMSLPTPPMAMPTIGLLQGGGIVDAVADHAHRLAVLLAGVDVSQLVLRQAARTAPLRMPSWPAMGRAAFSWSPVSSTGARPPPGPRWIDVGRARAAACPTGPGTRPAAPSTPLCR